MHENILATAARLSDGALLARLKVLAIRERDATVELVGHLAELDGRKTHLGEGPGSLYTYCRDVLGYSEDAAWNRAATANAVGRHPIILDWLADGSLNVTTVRMLRPVLTEGNHLAVLTEARRRSKREVDLIVRRFDPKPDVPSTIRKLPAPASVATPMLPREKDDPAPPPPVALPSARVHRPVIAPLTPERYRLQFTVSKETHDKLRRVQDLLCREIPDGDPAAIFERALDLLVHDVEKKKLAATAKPRPPRGTRNGSRDIPAHVRRTVWKRDGGQCAFSGRSGRCTERRFLEWPTSSRSAIRGRRRWTTSPSAVAPTTCTRANAYSAVSTRRSSARSPKSMLFPGNSRRSGTAGPNESIRATCAVRVTSRQRFLSPASRGERRRLLSATLIAAGLV